MVYPQLDNNDAIALFQEWKEDGLVIVPQIMSWWKLMIEEIYTELNLYLYYL